MMYRFTFTVQQTLPPESTSSYLNAVPLHCVCWLWWLMTDAVSAHELCCNITHYLLVRSFPYFFFFLFFNSFLALKSFQYACFFHFDFFSLCVYDYYYNMLDVEPSFCTLKNAHKKLGRRIIKNVVEEKK